MKQIFVLADCLAVYLTAKGIDTAKVEQACEACVNAGKPADVEASVDWKLTSFRNSKKEETWKGKLAGGLPLEGKKTIVSQFVAYSRDHAKMEKEYGAHEVKQTPAMFADWLASDGFKVKPVDKKPADKKAVKQAA